MFMLRCCYHCCCAAYFAANNQLTQLLFMCAVCERPSVHVCLCVYICFFRLCLFIEFMTLSLPTLQRQASVHMYVYSCMHAYSCGQNSRWLHLSKTKKAPLKAFTMHQPIMLSSCLEFLKLGFIRLYNKMSQGQDYYLADFSCICRCARNGSYPPECLCICGACRPGNCTCVLQSQPCLVCQALYVQCAGGHRCIRTVKIHQDAPTQ